ncbi:hypothetical protein [Rhabdothermincola sp.]|uniref:hypothetical protein n=1 Tax=Rhabdothermincola sp. TaxID=2820405 RepID=UPI002FE1F99F
MKLRPLIAAAGGAALLVTGLVAGSPSAGAGEGSSATLTVTKTVQGQAPADAEFVIQVYCESVDDSGEVPIVFPVVDEVLVFGAQGGSEQFVLFQEAECSVNETVDGGAEQIIGDGGAVSVENPTRYELEIINVFSGGGTTSTTAASTTTTGGATTTTAAAEAAVVTPRFTG